MYHPKIIIDLIADNVRKTRNPFGIPKSMLNRWRTDTPVRPEGNTLLFTGLMYQFTPYIAESTYYLQRYEDTKWADYIQYSKYLPKFIAGTGLALLTPREEKKKADRILANIVTILAKSNTEFYYDPELDDYSGILLYDLGDQESFVRHAEFVAAKLKRAGVRKIITVDPHTTYALKVLFPKYVGSNFEVKTYFEMIRLRDEDRSENRGHVTLHDPCFYGRYLELSDVPRKVLAGLGIECADVVNSGQGTVCCGGPAESVSPKLCKEILDRRAEELQSTGQPVVAMCPICLENLKKSGVKVEDMSALIARSLSP